jgi:serine/threonine-protein kinase
MTATLLNNRYQVLQTLGGGGFSNTFLAEDTHMPSRRRCVIKQLKPVANDPQAYQLVQERFQREAAVLEDLGEGSNQIPKLFAYFTEAGQFYLVQEFIEGDTLTKRVEKVGALRENEVKQLIVSLLPVLDYVHNRHMVHRDIKPDNVIIRNRDNLPVLIDFGAVKEAMNTVVNDPRNSAPSMVIGTPGYMPSEQAGGRPTYASDLYSLGLTAVFLLTGRMPQELTTDARTGEFLWRQYAPNINPNLATVIDRAIRFNARDRFSSAREMLNALQTSDAAAASSSAPSEMATVAVAPGGLPHPGNRPTPTAPIANSSPAHTVPAGTNPVIARPGSDRKPLIIGALVAGGLLLAAIAIGLGLRRSPEPSSQVASSSTSTSEQPTTQQPPSPTPYRSQAADPKPVSEPATQQPSASTTTRSRSDTTPPVVSESFPSTQAPSQTSTRPVPPQSNQTTTTEARNNNQNSDASRSVPGFPPGTQQRFVREELGKPTNTTSGLWNTRAVLYKDVVPDQVDLGYLFDPSSGRLRQTEATFNPSVERDTMSQTLEKMLNGNASPDIQQGLKDVYQGKSNRYRFVSGRDGSLKGTIERNQYNRIYIAVWESDLHD